MFSQFSKQYKLAISIILFGLSLAAWISLSLQFGMGTAQAANMMEGFSAFQLVLFLGVWLIMMSAMMFPSVAPMVTTYAALAKQRDKHEQLFASTLIFLSGYLITWVSFGILAYFINLFLQNSIMKISVLQSHATLIPAFALVLAGTYQLTRLKYICLSHCRTPLGFILNHWKQGKFGALRMGIDHGFYCVGCCWALMILLVVVGIMNLTWMLLLALYIFIEKIDKRGFFIGRVVGIFLIAIGLIIAFLAFW